ncbi:RluA family pseudouridine synthase [Desulfovibrio sp. 1188_IL3213]|uniref:pseudouridine synthase family protein n=2 Tax=unclassified Desulfovibrio TaxID=2593640 RepID=UPI002FD9E2A5
MSEDNPPPTQAPGASVTEIPVVQEPESGQKLLQFLQRRLNLPQAMLHRWVRTGQVRINGSRCKPFSRVQTGDTVRLPPFAMKMAAQCDSASPAPEGKEQRKDDAAEDGPPLPPLVGKSGYLWAFDKPAGLPVHPGTGHEDSLTTRLACHFARASFMPTPVHRLDRGTSGVILVAASYAALDETQRALRANTVHKEYVAWVAGRWPHEQTCLVRHFLRKEAVNGFERVRPVRAAAPDAKEALCLVRALSVGDRASLVQVRLLTGRTHQIRVQLSSLGHPVLGDAKYGQARAGATLYLHSLRIALPEGPAFTCLPTWSGPHALTALPEGIACDQLACRPPSCPDGAFPLGEDAATISPLH